MGKAYIAGTVDIIEMGFGQESPKIGRTLLSFRGVHLLEEWAALTSESPHRRAEVRMWTATSTSDLVFQNIAHLFNQ